MKLVINNLTKTYKNGVKAIDNLSIEIGTGMFGLFCVCLFGIKKRKKIFIF